MGMRLLPLRPLAWLGLVLSALSPLAAGTPPAVGQPAPDFTLTSLEGETVSLGKLERKQAVVLVMLRGWPGYQCPVCDRQVNDFIEAREQFAAAGARVVFVYPGPAAGLTARAAEFRAWKGREWPADYLYLLDPDYAFTLAYGLRWEADKETAYPSTFILDRSGVVRFAQVSRTHGGRTKAVEIVAALRELSAGR